MTATMHASGGKPNSARCQSVNASRLVACPSTSSGAACSKNDAGAALPSTSMSALAQRRRGGAVEAGWATADAVNATGVNEHVARSIDSPILRLERPRAVGVALTPPRLGDAAGVALQRRQRHVRRHGLHLLIVRQ